jgi:hypothetical protein
MSQELSRLPLSNQPVVCRECGKDLRGPEMNEHTELTGHSDFRLKTAIIPGHR